MFSTFTRAREIWASSQIKTSLVRNLEFILPILPMIPKRVITN